MYGPEFVLVIVNFEWNHVLTFFLVKIWRKGQFHNFSKTNKAIDRVFATRHYFTHVW